MTERPKEPFHWKGDEIKGQAQEEFNKSAEGREPPQKPEQDRGDDTKSMIQKSAPQQQFTPSGNMRRQSDHASSLRRLNQEHQKENNKLQKAKVLAKDIQNRQQPREQEKAKPLNQEKAPEKDNNRKLSAEEKLAKVKETAREITSRNNSHNSLQWDKGGRGER